MFHKRMHTQDRDILSMEGNFSIQFLKCIWWFYTVVSFLEMQNEEEEAPGSSRNESAFNGKIAIYWWTHLVLVSAISWLNLFSFSWTAFHRLFLSGLWTALSHPWIQNSLPNLSLGLLRYIQCTCGPKTLQNIHMEFLPAMKKLTCTKKNSPCSKCIKIPYLVGIKCIYPCVCYNPAQCICFFLNFHSQVILTGSVKG